MTVVGVRSRRSQGADGAAAQQWAPGQSAPVEGAPAGEARESTGRQPDAITTLFQPETPARPDQILPRRPLSDSNPPTGVRHPDPDTPRAQHHKDSCPRAGDDRGQPRSLHRIGPVRAAAAPRRPRAAARRRRPGLSAGCRCRLMRGLDMWRPWERVVIRKVQPARWPRPRRSRRSPNRRCRGPRNDHPGRQPAGFQRRSARPVTNRADGDQGPQSCIRDAWRPRRRATGGTSPARLRRDKATWCWTSWWTGDVPATCGSASGDRRGGPRGPPYRRKLTPTSSATATWTPRAQAVGGSGWDARRTNTLTAPRARWWTREKHRRGSRGSTR